MRSRDPSPSRGQMTITLKTAAGETDETARVRIEVNNPELVAERVVNQLAKRFPPESVVTLATTNGGGATTEDDDTLPCGTEDGETTSSGGGGDRLASNGSYRPRRNAAKILPSDCGSTECVKNLWQSQYYLVSSDLDMAVPVCENQDRVRLCDRSSISVNPNDVMTVWHDETGHATVAAAGYARYPPTLSAELSVPVDNRGISRYSQDYLISDSLERAVPLCSGQTQVHLIDDNEVSVKPSEVYTVHYGDKGVAMFHRRPDGTVLPSLPNKPGLAICVVPHRVRSIAATPISAARVPTQRDARSDIHVVLYDDSGLPICVRGPTGGLVPDGLKQKGAACSVEYYWSPSKSGGGATQRISTIDSDNKATLANGEVLNISPNGISVVLRHRESHTDIDRPPVLTTRLNDGLHQKSDRARPITASHRPEDDSDEDRRDRQTQDFVDDDDSRSPRQEYSRRRHGASDVHQSARESDNIRGRGRDQRIQHDFHLPHLAGGTRDQNIRGVVARPAMDVRDRGGNDRRGRGAHDIRGHDLRSPNRQRTQHVTSDASEDDLPTTGRRRASPPRKTASEIHDDRRKRRQSPHCEEGSESLDDPEDYYQPPRRRREIPTWATHTTSTTDSVFEDEDDDMAVKLNRRDPTSESYARSQTYFLPAKLDFAIPVQAEQSHVKLANGDKLLIQPSQTFTVEYDRRGLPMKTVYSDGATVSWMPSRQGVAAKFQDYFVHKDLLSAVPIRPDQTEVVLNDGTTVSVPENNVVSVFYDGSGRAAFTISGSKKRIRPGLSNKNGLAYSVQYLNMVDAGDGSGEQFVVPFKAHQKEVPDPRKPSRKMAVNRKAITVAFFDKAKKPLYTQLPDGTIVGGGLAGSRLTTSEEASTFDTTSLLSDSSGPVLRIPYTERPRRISVGKVASPKAHTRPHNENHTESQSARTANESTTVRPKRQEIIEIRIPVQQIEYIDKIVEVPEIHYVDKHVEVEQIEWQTKIVKKREVIERPVEHIKYIPKVETKIVEHLLEKTEYIEVPVPKIIEQKKKVDRFVDTRKNITVQQTIRPVIKDTLEIFEDIECLTLEPELIPVDVFVPRLVKSRLIAVGTTKEAHKELDVPLAHYNSLLLKMNPLFANNYEKLPMIKNASGSFPLLPSDQQVTVLAPTPDEITQVLKNAGVVSRSATQAEVIRLANRARRRSITDEDSVGQFAPRTCVIDPFSH